jgi:hypothetical protein
MMLRGCSLLVLLAQVAMVALMWLHGWVFVGNRVVLAVPTILVPAVILIGWSVPRL